MDSLARLSELMQRFLVQRPKELERASGFVQRSTAVFDTQKPVITLRQKRATSWTPRRKCYSKRGPLPRSSQGGTQDEQLLLHIRWLL